MDPFLLFIVWVVCGFLAAGIANTKGHSFGGWLLIGFFLGIIGLIAAILIGPKGEALDQEQLATGHARTCPYCAETIKAEAVVCRHCGRDVEPLPAPIYQGSAYAQVGKCSECGASVRADATGCVACGTRYAAPPERA